MTSAPQIIGPGTGGITGFGFPGLGARPKPGEEDRDTGTLPGRGAATGSASSALPGREGATDGSTALPGRVAASDGASGSVTASNVVRLPGQELIGGDGPRRPLISGGAFTLAVAIGLALDQQTAPEGAEPATPATVAETGPEGGEGDRAEGPGEEDLDEEEQAQVRELKQRDAEVKRHEAAHAAAGGQFAGAPTYTYQRGPDGRQYAVGGEVSIDTSPVQGDPQATIRKAQQIRAAASAPADPSSQDRRVAAQADALRRQAEAELRSETREEQQAEEAAAQEAEAAAQEGEPQGASGAAGLTASAFAGAVARYQGPSTGPQLVSFGV